MTTTINVTQEQLEANDIVFNNEERDEEEAYSVELSHSATLSGTPFHLWVNGELVSTYRTLNGLVNRATVLIGTRNLQRVA